MGSHASETGQTGIPKIPTRIQGLDEILYGGLPAGKVTVISGRPGAGKSLMGLSFVYNGALAGEPGIFLSFEEPLESIRQNAGTLGWDLASLEREGKLSLIEGAVDAGAIIAGRFSLKGFFAIIEGKAAEIGAGRIVIDALDVLTAVFDDPVVEHRELFALQHWLRQQGMTAVLTTKSGLDGISFPFERIDFMADCLIYLDQRIQNQVSTKRLRVIKYRGSPYGTNEYPFLVIDGGIHFNPISNISLDYELSDDVLSSGLPALDRILGGGYRRGACILISGFTGAGKTSLASTFSRSACNGGQKVLYVSFEESADSLVKGMQSIGVDLAPSIQAGRLWIKPVMPESAGIEEHLYRLEAAIRSFGPDHLVLDAISACKRIAGEHASFDFLLRLVHFCKTKGITMILNNQSDKDLVPMEISGMGISSIIDGIIMLGYRDTENDIRRFLQVIKLRGSKHATRRHEFFINGNGIQISDNIG